VDADDWEADLADSREFFAKFGKRLPKELMDEHEKLSKRFSKAVTAAK
jgi:GTP-dependent phosphoenolpyruvate carboxykinase